MARPPNHPSPLSRAGRRPSSGRWLVRAVLVGAGCLLAAGGWAVARMPRVEVAGASMTPTLAPGDRLAVVPLGPRRGRLVVVRDPREVSRTLVKRAVRVRADGAVRVAGDNAVASTDSRHFGWVPADLVVGRPLYRYEPADDAGWLWST